jgi:hypothetical protein
MGGGGSNIAPGNLGSSAALSQQFRLTCTSTVGYQGAAPERELRRTLKSGSGVGCCRMAASSV